jgi:mannose-6-phosphate isomerase-like protein (cupin superfamily)
MIRRCLGAAMLAGVAVVVVWLTAGYALATSAAPSSVSVKVLAQGQVKAFPVGKVFDSILEFRQNPGADFGPHAHVPGIVYTLRGTSTISYAGGSQKAVGEGQAAFIPALVTHTHQNLDGRVGAGAIAIGLIAVTILLCTATLLHGARRSIVVVGLSAFLIVGGALPVLGATSNDYYLFAVRSPVEHDRPMPRPDGRVEFLSADLNPVPPGPYVETLSAITIRPGATYDAPVVKGPQIVVVLQGSSTVRAGGETSQLGVGGATMAQAGQTLTIFNSGGNPLQVLDFAVASVGGSPAAP